MNYVMAKSKPFPVGATVTLKESDKELFKRIEMYMPGKFPALVVGYSPPGYGTVVVRFKTGRETYLGAKDLKRVGKSLEKGVTSHTLLERLAQHTTHNTQHTTDTEGINHV